MASAWLDIAVDWENPSGWNIPELLNIIIEAYNERIAITVNNNGVRGSNTMPVLNPILLDTNNDVAPFVVNHNSLNEINTRLEELLTSSQNRTTYLPSDVEYWTVSDFLTEKGLPLNLMPVDFTCEIFNYQWITYWFYILNEMFLLHSFTWDANTSGLYKRSTTMSTFAGAVTAFNSATYSVTGGDDFLNGAYKYNLDTTPSPQQEHDITQTLINSIFIFTRDANNNFFEIDMELRVKLYIQNPTGYSMTWDASSGDVFDLTSQIAWDGVRYTGSNINIPDITPQIDASTLGVPNDTPISFEWACGDNVFGRPTYIHSTDFNDENLISYTPIV